jgi:glutamate/tyrosine decarboxylase-like PLP-dependent enzyme
VLPYSVGNLHPGFMGWVHGGGTAVGMLAEMLAGGLNANCGGRNHAPIAVERQVIAWSAEMLGLPPDTAGLLVTGTSVANLIAVLVARRAALGATVRSAGVGGARLVAYTSAAAHGCIPRAMDMAGLGTAALRMVPTDARGGMDVAVLAHLIRSDREAGAQPFLVVGTAGSVDTGAIDDLDGLATVCRREGLWFHVDAAFGAMAMLSPRLRPLLSGVEQADSVAFDFHKWAQVPYDAGCILVRDPARALDTFAQDADYLRREMRGLAGGHPWPCDLGPDLSRGFRALKVWMTLSAYGADALGAVVERCCALAGRLGAAVEAHEALELLAPVRLNIVCFRVRALDDAGNAALVVALHEAGSFAPSTTRIGGRLAIRAAIVNHRTDARDIDGLLRAVLSASSAGQA